MHLGRLNPREISLDFLEFGRLRNGGGLQSREGHISPIIRGGLISAGFVKFGRSPKGGYNLEKQIYIIGTGGCLIPANFSRVS